MEKFIQYNIFDFMVCFEMARNLKGISLIEHLVAISTFLRRTKFLHYENHLIIH